MFGLFIINHSEIRIIDVEAIMDVEPLVFTECLRLLTFAIGAATP